MTRKQEAPRTECALDDPVRLFREMKRIRCVEETIAEKYPEQRMRCPTHLSTGQEAVAVGVCSALTGKDLVVGSHRSHAHYLAKGGNLDAMIAEIHGKVTGCSRGKGGSMHLVDLSVGFLGSTSIVASSIPVGVGTALTSQLQRKDRVSVTFFGDAGIEEGAFHEAANFAVLRRLPVLFVCENNLYSVYSSLSVRQPQGREIWRFAAAYGMRAERGDGNDVLQVSRTAGDAVAYIRAGNGPAFLEFATYRWREHCGPNYDNDLGYRTEEEFRSWRAKDPIRRLEKELCRRGALDVKTIRGMEDEIQEEVCAAFKFAQESPFPEPTEAFQGLFAE